MYKLEHRFLVLSASAAHLVMTKQSGIWEQLLCQSCDNSFSPHEKYVRELFHGGQKIPFKRNGRMVTLEGVEYLHVRLCFLSILWKMSISSRPMFRNVNLGPHEARLAYFLRDNNPGDSFDFGFSCAIPFLKGQVLSELILEPTVIRFEGHRAYRVVMGGFVVLFFVSSHCLPQDTRACFIRPDGTWNLLLTPVEELPFIHQSLINMARNNKLKSRQENPRYGLRRP